MMQMDVLKGLSIKDKISMFNKVRISQIKPVEPYKPTMSTNLRASVTPVEENTIDNFKDPFLGWKTLEELTKPNDTINETVLKDLQSWLGDGFCEGFFLASFPDKNAKVAEKSQEYISFCGHQQCCMLPAMEPEIIARYPLKDTKTLELNNLAATICFPSGIKVCYAEEQPRTVRNYSTPITNQQGERYYMMTYHFYYKMLNSEFSKQYQMHPLKHHLMKFADGYIGLKIDTKLQKKIEENLALCEELAFREVIYVPYCLCLISKFPFVHQMEKCLQSLYSMISDFSSNSSKDINDVIMFLVHSVPIPEINTLVKLYLPFTHKTVDITCPKMKDVNIAHNLTNFFNIFTIEQILTIFRLMLFEKKILFVGKDYSQLSQVIDNFISILYPFQWVHTYIPIMSYQMIQYLQTFLPFINGIHHSLMPFVSETLYENEEDVYIIYLEKEEDKKGRKYQMNININLRPETKKKIDIEKKINETTPFLPKKLSEKLQAQLESIGKGINNSPLSSKATLKEGMTPHSSIESTRALFDMQIRNAFIEFFADMFNDYEKYLCNVDDYVVFNSKLFIEERPKEDTNFYTEFTESQLFEQFTQSVLKEDTFKYFNMIIANKKRDANKKKIEETNFTTEHTYYINPEFLHINATDVQGIEKELAEKYSSSLSSTYHDGIIKEENRIIGRINNIEPLNFILPKCRVYLLPGALSKKPQFSLRKSLDISILMKANIFESRAKKNLENRKKSLLRRLGEKELSPKEQDEIKERLRDSIIAIFKSDVSVLNEDKKQIIQMVSGSFGRGFLIKLIGQNNTSVKILKEEAFKSLYDIILNALISMLKEDETEQTMREAVSLLKASLFYGTNQKTLIWTTLCEKMKNFNYLLKNEFWSLWEKTEKEENKEDVKVILVSVCERMLDLKMEKDFIKKTLNELAEKDIQQEEECLNFKNKILDLISKKKY